MQAHDSAAAGQPVAVLDGIGALVAEPGAAAVRLEARAALQRLQGVPHLVCHAGYLVDRLALVAEAPRPLRAGARDQRHLDLAELFAFAAPAVVATRRPTASCARSGWRRWPIRSPRCGLPPKR
jgi:ATP-dependent DNA helicase DinG